jgi:IS66 C-terminal element
MGCKSTLSRDLSRSFRHVAKAKIVDRFKRLCLCAHSCSQNVSDSRQHVAQPEMNMASLTGVVIASRRPVKSAVAMARLSPTSVVGSLIVSAKMNDVDPQVWLADVLARIATHPAHRLDELLPWNWKTAQQQGLAAQAA